MAIRRGNFGCIVGLLAAIAAPPGVAGVLGEASGTGPWPAVAELVDALPTHTIYRPAKLPKAALPLFVWGNGACRDNGLAHGAFLRQIASQGYFVVSVGRPREERPFNPAPPPDAARCRAGHSHRRATRRTRRSPRRCSRPSTGRRARTRAPAASSRATST